MGGERGETRKVRSDKKVDVKPTMSIKLKRQLYKLSELCDEPVKDVAERLCEKGSVSLEIVDDICSWFRRDYFVGPAIYKGYLERPRLKLILGEDTEKVTIKFPQYTYDQICTLAFSLDLSPTTTTAVLIKRTINNRQFMFDFVKAMTHLSNAEKNVIHVFLRKVWGYV